MGGAGNLLSHVLVGQLYWQTTRRTVRRWRRDILRLPPGSIWGHYGQMDRERVPFLYGYSSAVVPKPRDWGPWHHVTGYWFLNPLSDWQPPAPLVNFLESGPPPVCVSFGSMTSRDPRATSRLVIAALRRAGQRGICLNGWGALDADEAADDVLTCGWLPIDWLFPRVAAVVHHGGAGTTASGLRAGAPSVITPAFGQQYFWSERVAALGVGPRSVDQSQLTAEQLAAAIRLAVSDETMKVRADNLGRRIQAENGVRQAVAVIDRYLGRTR
jgi:UDP:flavonoid glycosyltransferase YjiC (YdhE family)